MKTFNFYEKGELEFIHGEWYVGIFADSSFGMEREVPSQFSIEYSWQLYDKKDCPWPTWVCYSEDKTTREYGKLGDTRGNEWLHEDDYDEFYFKLEANIIDHYEQELKFYMLLEEYNEIGSKL